MRVRNKVKTYQVIVDLPATVSGSLTIPNQPNVNIVANGVALAPVDAAGAVQSTGIFALARAAFQADYEAVPESSP